MTKHFLLLVVVVLALYSAALIAVELSTSQETVRNYLADIEGPVPFFALNTSLCMFLLGGTALLFIACLAVVRGTRVPGRLRLFYGSQVVVFAFLGADERFLVHEALAWRTGIYDHFILLAVASVELACLLFLGGRAAWRGKPGRFLLAGILLFCVMMAIDIFAPHDLVLRLTLEDLTKTWGALCFLLFAWAHLFGHVDRLKAAAAGTDA